MWKLSIQCTVLGYKPTTSYSHEFEKRIWYHLTHLSLPRLFERNHKPELSQLAFIICKLNITWQHLSLMKKYPLYSKQNIFKYCKCSRLSSLTSSSIYNWLTSIESNFPRVVLDTFEANTEPKTAQANFSQDCVVLLEHKSTEEVAVDFASAIFVSCWRISHLQISRSPNSTKLWIPG